MKPNINLRPERYQKRKGYCWIIRNDKAYILILFYCGVKCLIKDLSPIKILL